MAVRSTVKKGTNFVNRNVQKGVEFAVEHGHEGSVKALALAKERQAASRQSSSSSYDPVAPPSAAGHPSGDLMSFDDDPPIVLGGGDRKKAPPPIPSKPSHLSTSPSPNGDGPQISKRPLFSRLLLAGDVLLTSLESSAGQVIGSASTASTASITHKYGAEAGEASRLAGGSVVNVTATFVDARGIGRRAIVKGAGKGQSVERIVIPSLTMLTAYRWRPERLFARIYQDADEGRAGQGLLGWGGRCRRRGRCGE